VVIDPVISTEEVKAIRTRSRDLSSASSTPSISVDDGDATSLSNIQEMYGLVGDLPEASVSGSGTPNARQRYKLQRESSKILRLTDDGQLYVDHWANDEDFLAEADLRETFTQEQLALREVLLNGAKFNVFGKSGDCLPKFVFVSTQGNIHWTDIVVNSTADAEENKHLVTIKAGDAFIRMRDVQQVLAGKATEIFRKSVAATAAESRCLSVITAARTLDLQAETDAIAERWLLALMSAIAHYKTKNNTAVSGSVNRTNFFGGVDSDPFQASAKSRRTPLNVPKELEQDTEAVESIRFLDEGQILVKFGRNGKPKPRWINVGNGKLFWSDPRSKGTPADEVTASMIYLTKVTNIATGKTTEVFSKAKDSSSINDLHCFSVICKDRTLDLVASSEIQRDKWVKALQFVVEKAKEKEKDNWKQLLQRNATTKGPSGSPQGFEDEAPEEFDYEKGEAVKKSARSGRNASQIHAPEKSVSRSISFYPSASVLMRPIDPAAKSTPESVVSTASVPPLRILKKRSSFSSTKSSSPRATAAGSEEKEKEPKETKTQEELALSPRPEFLRMRSNSNTVSAAPPPQHSMAQTPAAAAPATEAAPITTVTVEPATEVTAPASTEPKVEAESVPITTQPATVEASDGDTVSEQPTLAAFAEPAAIEPVESIPSQPKPAPVVRPSALRRRQQEAQEEEEAPTAPAPIEPPEDDAQEAELKETEQSQETVDPNEPPPPPLTPPPPPPRARRRRRSGPAPSTKIDGNGRQLLR